MKNISLLFLLLLFSGKISAQSATADECNQFRTGTFTYKAMPDIIIERDSLYQTERNPADGSYVKMSIKWTSPCTYELRLVDTNKRKDKKFWKKIKVLTVTITYVDDDGYRFSCTSPAIETPIVGTVLRKN